MGFGPNAARRLLDDPAINVIANRHKKTAAQVVLRWHLQLGYSAIPKSARHDRLSENVDIFDFDLDADEIQNISALNTSQRAGSDPVLVGA